MSKVIDPFEKQANELKTNRELLKAAEQMQAAAKVLFEKASKPVMLDHKLLAQNKQARAEKFAADVAKGHIRELDTNMASHGWQFVRGESQTEKRFYFNKDYPNYHVVVKAGKFTVLYKNDSIENLKDINLKDPHTLGYINPGRFVASHRKTFSK